MKQIFFIFLICHCMMAKSQDIEKPLVPFLTLQDQSFAGGNANWSIIPGFSPKKAVTVFAGTQGLGADFRYGFLPRLSARFGGSVTPVNLPNAFTINDFNSSIDMNIKFANVHLIADFQPFPGSGVRLAFGVGYFLQAKTIADITPRGDNSFGNINYTPDDLGKLQMTADWQGIAPYLGLGFFRTFPSTIFNINLDLGTYYLTAPQTTIVGTKALAPNEANNAQFQKNLSSYRWLPVLQLNFNFRL